MLQQNETTCVLRLMLRYMCIGCYNAHRIHSIPVKRLVRVQRASNKNSLCIICCARLTVYIV